MTLAVKGGVTSAEWVFFLAKTQGTSQSSGKSCWLQRWNEELGESLAALMTAYLKCLHEIDAILQDFL